LKYTSTLERGFRGGAFIMRTHDHLLRSVAGCDGLKTGFISAGGFSIVATAQRGGRRIIAVLMGCPTRVGRDKVAAELIEKGFMNLPPLPPPPPPPAPEKHALPVKDTASQWRWIIKVCMLAAGAVLLLVVGIIIGKRKS
jgi:D-alanyl-D-alanine carboxypeptidase